MSKDIEKLIKETENELEQANKEVKELLEVMFEKLELYDKKAYMLAHLKTKDEPSGKLAVLWRVITAKRKQKVALFIIQEVTKRASVDFMTANPDWESRVDNKLTDTWTESQVHRC